MLVLGVDPGSAAGLGWALLDSDRLRLVASGTAFVQRPESGTEAAAVRDRTLLWGTVIELCNEWGQVADVIAYEDVMSHSSVWAAHLYGGQIAMLQWWAHCQDKPFCPVPVQTIKRCLGCRAAGKDKAKAMVAAAHRLGYTKVTDHNEADAIGVALGALWLHRNRSADA